jgi:hypothetical protein
MENDAQKAKTGEQDKHLLRITPVETDRTEKDTVTQRQWTADRSGRFFPANLSVEQMKQALAKGKVKIENLLLKVDGDTIVYRYKGRPLIRLNLKDGQFYAPASVLEVYGKELVQHQVSIVLDKLREGRLSGAAQGKTVHSSSARDVLSKLKSYNQDH